MISSQDNNTPTAPGEVVMFSKQDKYCYFINPCMIDCASIRVLLNCGLV